MLTKAQIYALTCVLSILTNQYKPFSNKSLPLKHTTQNISTSVENPLQINPFMQNKPKLRKLKMTINYCTQRTYKDSRPLELPENKPKQSQTPKHQNDYIPLFKKDLQKFPPFRAIQKRTQNEAKTNPKQTQLDNYGKNPLPA